MTNTHEIKVNISLNGPIDTDKIMEAVRAEIDRVGVKVEIAAPAAETITHNGVEFKRVDREAKPGDVVHVTDAAEPTDDIPNDKFYLVDENGKIGHRIKHDVYPRRYNRTPANVKVYEPVAKEQPLKVGDYVKAVEKGVNDADFKIGEIAQIVEIGCPTGNKKRHRVKHLHNDIAWFMTEGTEIVRATDEEVAEAKAAAKFASINEGDLVKVVARMHGHNFNIGETVRISEKRENDFKAEYLDGHDFWYIKADELEKLTADEIAEQSEADRWAAIGRKPNEFKAGDIVRVNGSTGGHKVGTIGEVVYDEKSCALLRVEALGVVRSHLGQMELITPVEFRFDRA